MSLLKDRKKRDMDVAGKFQNRFRKMIVGRDKKTGNLVVLFRSKADAMISILTGQKKLEDL